VNRPIAFPFKRALSIECERKPIKTRATLRKVLYAIIKGRAEVFAIGRVRRDNQLRHKKIRNLENINIKGKVNDIVKRFAGAGFNVGEHVSNDRRNVEMSYNGVSIHIRNVYEGSVINDPATKRMINALYETEPTDIIAKINEISTVSKQIDVLTEEKNQLTNKLCEVIHAKHECS
jgi:hypothetical protein